MSMTAGADMWQSGDVVHTALRSAFYQVLQAVEHRDETSATADDGEKECRTLRHIAQGQRLLGCYRLLRQGMVPDEKTLEALRASLLPEFEAQLTALQQSSQPAPQLSVESLANQVLKGHSKLSRLVTVQADFSSAIKQGARMEALRQLQKAVSRKFLKRAHRTPDQIFAHVSSKDAGITLPVLLQMRERLSESDAKEDIRLKLEMLMGSHAGSTVASRTANRWRPGTASHLFASMARLKGVHTGNHRLHVARVNHVRADLMSIIKNFNDVKKIRRETARHIARSAAAFAASLEARRIQQQERDKKERMRALRENDMEAYARLIKHTKNARIQEILAHTDKLLEDIGAKIELDKSTAEQLAQDQQRKAAAKAEEKEAGKVPEDAAAVKEKEREEAAAVEPLREKAQYYTLSHRVREQVSQPACMVGGKLMPYQLAGLDFLVSLYNNNLSGILADEMGLGKTIQTISLLAHLKEAKGVQGPHLIAVPLSTLPNWASEFGKWAPSLKVLQYRGSKHERKVLNTEVRRQRYNVLLTTFEYIIRETRVLQYPHWKFIVVDEGHKMKNVRSKFHSTLGMFRSTNRLLLTGTPLQNNLNELWALLNFLMPKTFSSSEDFEHWFEQPFRDQSIDSAEDASLTEEEKLVVINRLHLVLRPFLLRRVKADVLTDLPSKREYIVRVQLSCWQQLVYEQLVNRCLRVRDASGKITSRSVANVIMQLRKAVNHPYLFLDEYNIDDNLWRVSGKFELLDRMLPKLLKFKHKVLIFCQMTQVMDIMGDYFDLKGMTYHRLDGSMQLQDRKDRMDDFNSPTSKTNIFMLSTRAGGLGLNLQAADTVILFDSDWNPHQDLQAQARAHRVGQKNEVRVFRLVTVSPVEELILAKAQHKLSIDEQIIQAGMFSNKFNEQEREDRLRELLSQKGKSEDVRVTSPPDLNRYMARNDAEYEVFTHVDRKLFGPVNFAQFFEQDELEDSEGLQSLSGGSVEQAAESDVSKSPKSVTSPSAVSGTQRAISEIAHEQERAANRQDKDKLEEILIQSGRLISRDAVPENIVLLPAEPQEEMSQVPQELGERRAKLRALHSGAASSSTPRVSRKSSGPEATSDEEIRSPKHTTRSRSSRAATSKVSSEVQTQTETDRETRTRSAAKRRRQRSD